jgi:hypothetical protein
VIERGICCRILHTSVMIGRRKDLYKRRDGSISSIHPIFYHQVGGRTNSHLPSKSQISYAIECLEPRLFNWSVGFLRNVKEKISKCRTGREKKVWIWFFLGLIFPRADSIDATIGCSDSTPCG